MVGELNIAIIGAGQLGSRHLQALAKLQYRSNLFVVDPMQTSLEIAKDRYEEVRATQDNGHRIEYLSDMELLPKQLHTVVIATNSSVRRTVVEQLLQHSEVNFILLEKFLFPRMEDYEVVGDLLRLKKVQAFVNCGRRMWPLSVQLKSMFSQEEHIRYKVSASNLGIGCNAIHFLDQLAFITNDYQFNLHSDGLDAGHIESKRPGYIEFTGLLEGFSEKDHYFQIESYNAGNAPVCIQIESRNVRCVIDERQGLAMISKASDNWTWSQESFEVLYQSNLTHNIITQFIENNSSDLPTYEESSILHKSILAPLLHHLSIEFGNEVQSCPIT